MTYSNILNAKMAALTSAKINLEKALAECSDHLESFNNYEIFASFIGEEQKENFWSFSDILDSRKSIVESLIKKVNLAISDTNQELEIIQWS